MGLNENRALGTKMIHQIQNWCLLISGCCSLLNITWICVVPRIRSPFKDAHLLQEKKRTSDLDRKLQSAA